MTKTISVDIKLNLEYTGSLLIIKIPLIKAVTYSNNTKEDVQRAVQEAILVHEEYGLKEIEDENKD